MAQRSRIWEMLEDATKNLMSKFDDEGKEIVEESMAKFNRPEDGWINRVWETPEARRCHIDVVDARESKKLYMFHCVVIPHFHTPAPIWGLDVIAGPNKVTGLFHDWSPLSGKREVDHPMVEWFCEESKTYEPSKVRELPDWALEIFSPGMIAAGNINTERELTNALSLACTDLGPYFTLLRRYKQDFNLNSNIKSEKEVKEAQNRYTKFQRENPHTPRTMKALGLPEKDIEEFCTDALFPYAE